MSSRENRYLAGPVSIDSSFSRDAAYKMVLYTLKHPLAPSITRNLRPYVSRYARVINFSDAHTLIISDMGINIDRLIKIIEAMDTAMAYKNFLAQKPQKTEQNSEEQEKILALELENKFLEKKYLELKETQSVGGQK
jgi:type II secretory pathway component GspD/PulD (secretin)